MEFNHTPTKEHTMTFHAKFPGSCPCCGQRIQVGMPVAMVEPLPRWNLRKPRVAVHGICVKFVESEHAAAIIEARQAREAA